METMNFITQLFELCIFPALLLLGKYLITFIDFKTKELKNRTENDIEQKYLDRINKTIVDCIKTTNQTYVNSLKESGNFTEEAQKEAFQKTLNAVLIILGEDSVNYISSITEDVNTYLTQKIESTINDLKQK